MFDLISIVINTAIGIATEVVGWVLMTYFGRL